MLVENVESFSGEVPILLEIEFERDENGRQLPRLEEWKSRWQRRKVASAMFFVNIMTDNWLSSNATSHACCLRSPVNCGESSCKPICSKLIRELNELCALNCTSENVFSFSSDLEKRIRRIFKEITHVSCSVLFQLPAASVNLRIAKNEELQLISLCNKIVEPKNYAGSSEVFNWNIKVFLQLSAVIFSAKV